MFSSNSPNVIVNKTKRLVTFYRNGDPHFKGLQVSVNQRCFGGFESLLMWLNEKIPTTAGVRYIFRLPDGSEARDVTDIKAGNQYVVSSVKRLIRTVDYGTMTNQFWSNKAPSAGKMRRGEQRLFRLSTSASQQFEDLNFVPPSGSSNGTISHRAQPHRPPPHRMHPIPPSEVAVAQRNVSRVITIISNTHRNCCERVLVNRNTRQNFEDMLFDFSNLLVMSQPPVQTLYTAVPPYRRVCSFSQLFRDFHTIDRFIACGREFTPLEMAAKTIGNVQAAPDYTKKREAPMSTDSSEDQNHVTSTTNRRTPRKTMRAEQIHDATNNIDSSFSHLEFESQDRYQDGLFDNNNIHDKVVESTLAPKMLSKKEEHQDPPRPYEKPPALKIHPLYSTINGKNRIFWPPSNTQKGSAPSTALPTKRLQLDWVYGFNSLICGSRLLYLSNGVLAYAVSAIVVLHDSQRGRQKHYLEHSAMITCLEMHPFRAYIVSGQTQDISNGAKAHVRIWDADTLSTYAIIGEDVFQSTITSVSFSYETNGDQLLVVDGTSGQHRQSFYIIDWRNSRVTARSKTSRDFVYQALFHCDDDTTIITYGKQHIHFWRVFSDDNSEPASNKNQSHFSIRILRDKKSGLFVESVPEEVLCVAFDLVGNVVSGDSNGCIHVWVRDDEDAYVCRELSHLRHAHKDPITSIKILGDGTLLSTSSKSIRAWDTLNDYSLVKERLLYEASDKISALAVRHSRSMDGNFVVGTCSGEIFEGNLQEKFVTIVQGHSPQELIVIATHPKEHDFVTAGQDRFVCKWSSLQHRLVWRVRVEVPCYSIVYHSNGYLVLVGTGIGRFIVLQNSTGQHVVSYQINALEQPINTSHINAERRYAFLCITFSPDGKHVALGCEDGNIYIYLVEEDGMLYRKYKGGSLKGHASPVKTIDWSVEGKFLRSQSLDDELKFWNLKLFKQTDAEIVNNTKYLTEKATINFDTLGCWSKYANDEDKAITCCCKSSIGDKLCTGDTQGNLNLFNYPVHREEAKSRSIFSYSSSVNDISFLFDDNYLISSGKQQSSLLQWSIVDA